MAWHAAVALEPGGQDGQPFGAGQLVAAEHADGSTCFLQPGLGQPAGLADRLAELRVRASSGGEQPGGLQVQHQAGQRVGKHVVHLAG